MASFLKVEHDSKSMSDQTLDHIGEALVLYLTAVSSSLIDSKVNICADLIVLHRWSH